jgi:hypothetical protein
VDVPQRLFVRGRVLATPQWLLLGVFDWKTGVPFSTVNEDAGLRRLTERPPVSELRAAGARH